MNKYSVAALFCILIAWSHTAYSYIIGLVGAGVLGGLFCGYAQLRKTVSYQPTIKNMNTLTFRAGHDISPNTIIPINELVKSIYENNIPSKTYIDVNQKPFMVKHGIDITSQDTTVFIFARGYAKTTLPGTNDDFIQQGACAKAGYIQLQDDIVPHDVPLITFDLPDDQKKFAFGGPHEVACLQHVYKKILKKNPHVNIVLVGDCRGGKVALEWATQKPKNLTALILMAPFCSPSELSDQIADNHIAFLPGKRKVLRTFFATYFPSYRPEKENLLTRISHIAPSVPVFIAHRMSDTLVRSQNVATLKRKLSANGNQVSLVTTNDASKPHSLMTDLPEIQHGINFFLKEHGLPHHAHRIQRFERS